MKKHQNINNRTVLTLLAILLLAPSCKSKIDYDDYPQTMLVKVNLLWKTPKVVVDHPAGFYCCIYPQSQQTPFVDLLATDGGNIYLQQGVYNILTVNNDTRNVLFASTEHFNTFKAYTQPVIRPAAGHSNTYEQGLGQPSPLYVAVDSNFSVYPTLDTLLLTKTPRLMTVSIPFVFRGVTGIENVSQIRASLSGMAAWRLLCDGSLSDSTGTIFCDLLKTPDGFRGEVSTWGHYAAREVNHTFTVEFFYQGGVVTNVYDVTDMIHNDNEIDVYDPIKFAPSSDGGFDTEVGDWGQTDIVIPI